MATFSKSPRFPNVTSGIPKPVQRPAAVDESSYSTILPRILENAGHTPFKREAQVEAMFAQEAISMDNNSLIVCTSQQMCRLTG